MPEWLKNPHLVWATVAVFVVVVFIYVIISMSTESTATTINRACANHNGVSRIDGNGSGLVVCRDGVVVEY